MSVPSRAAGIRSMALRAKVEEQSLPDLARTAVRGDRPDVLLQIAVDDAKGPLGGATVLHQQIVAVFP